MMNSSQDVCAICLESLTVSPRRALFTAECCHAFHFNCIASSVQHGNHICPTCRRTWTNLPCQFPALLPPPPPLIRRNTPQTTQETTTLINYADDEPLPYPEPNSSTQTSTPQVHNQQSGQMTVKVFPERPAMSFSEESDSFSVLVGIRAPPLSPEASDKARALVDLVAVLDVSGSMQGDRIRLLKQAMEFVVSNMGPTDRISVITFSDTATRVTPLRIMGDEGKSDTIRAVNSLRAGGWTNIIAGLKLAVEVLEQRRQKKPVTSIILLSDGQDNQNGYVPYGARFLQSLNHLPTCIRANANGAATEVAPVPVYTFGFGSDHDATALHAIADGSGGTFSYIESIEILQDAFARCIGGLLSVVAQKVEIDMKSGVPGRVQIKSIASGMYRNIIDGNRGHGMIHVGDVYAEEEKKFLVNLSVPKEETDTSTTKLLEVKCFYTDPISNQESTVTETVTVEIRRPAAENLSEEERRVCVEVERERNRISVAEGIAQAQSMADRGEFSEAQGLIRQQRMRVATSGGARDRSIEREMAEIERGMENVAVYESGGKAFLCSKRSSHMYQRASTQAMSDTRLESHSMDADSEGGRYQTSSMLRMVNKSQELRQSGYLGERSGGSNGSK